jgi:hypothetical protein
VHGWYSQSPPATPPPLPPIVTVDQAVEDLGLQLARSSYLLGQIDDPEIFVRVFGQHAQALSRLGRLLRDKKILSGESADEIWNALAKAVDELGITL